MSIPTYSVTITGDHNDVILDSASSNIASDDSGSGVTATDAALLSFDTTTASNLVGLKIHHHTKNYLELDHHHVHASGTKINVGGTTYVVTSAHNVEEVQLPPYDNGAVWKNDLAVTSNGKFPVAHNLHGDGDVFVVGPSHNEREILVTSSALGVAFYDVTCSTSNMGSTLLDFKPRQSISDIKARGNAQSWNQVKANKTTKMVYEQPGETSLGEGEVVAITIYDASNAFNNEVVLVDKWNEKWDASNNAHKRIIDAVWTEVASKAKLDLCGNVLATYELSGNILTKIGDLSGTDLSGLNYTLDDLSFVFATQEEWEASGNIYDGYVIGDSHNLQIDSCNNLLFVIDVGCKDLTRKVGNMEITFPTLVYDIGPDINPHTNLPCSHSPNLVRVLEDSAELKVLTAAEKLRIKNNTETYDSDGHMILDMSINDISRGSVTLSAFGSLPRSAIDMSENEPFDWTNQTQYNHDVGIFIGGSGEKLITTCYQENGWFSRTNKNAWLFGYTFGPYAIYDVSNIKDTSGGLKVYQTPVHDGFKSTDTLGPMNSYAHNCNFSSNGLALYCSSELPGQSHQAADKDFTVTSMFSIYDLTDLENIKFKKFVSNYGTIKVVGKNDITKWGYDVNHNFSVNKLNGREYLAHGDYADGVAIFDIDASFGNIFDPILVAKANPVLRTMANDPYYATDSHGHIVPWAVDGNGSKWSGTWGCSLGPRGDLYVMCGESVAVYDWSSVGTTDIRDKTNTMTGQKFTKYPELKQPDYIKCYDYDNDSFTDLEIHDLDRKLDIALLKVKSGSTALTSGFTVSVNNSTTTTVGTKIFQFNGANNNKTMQFGLITNNNVLIAPSLVERVYYNANKEYLIEGESGKFSLDHQFVDLGLAGDKAKYNYASRVMHGVESILVTSSAGSGSSGGPVIDNLGNFRGMISSSIINGHASSTIAIDGKFVMDIATKLINGTHKLPYLGIGLTQDIMTFKGYLVNAVDPDGLVTGITVETTKFTTGFYGTGTVYDYNTQTFITVGADTSDKLVFELDSINDILVGPGRTRKPISMLYTLNIGDTVTLKFNPWRSSVNAMGTTVYGQLKDEPQLVLTVTLAEKTNIGSQLSIDETSDASGNPYPNYPWCFEELVGKYI